MSNYPPGVTGREYEIAGPDTEYESIAICENPDCVLVNTEQPAVIQGYRGQVWWTCGECGTTFDITRDPIEVYGTLEHEAWLIEMERQEDA